MIPVGHAPYAGAQLQSRHTLFDHFSRGGVILFEVLYRNHRNQVTILFHICLFPFSNRRRRVEFCCWWCCLKNASYLNRGRAGII